MAAPSFVNDFSEINEGPATNCPERADQAFAAIRRRGGYHHRRRFQVTGLLYGTGVPPRFSDSIGYLLELRDSRKEAWFYAVCDMAIACDGSPPAAADIDRLLDIFLGGQTYTPLAASVPSSPAVSAGSVANPHLERLGGFSGFKKLSAALDARFPTQLSLIFGKNGSGKSSLCQALKLLASPDPPMNPIENVRAQYPPPPSFTYRFRSAFSDASWDETRGYGLEEQSIKYLDASIAHRHITGAVQPEAVVEVSAFRTELFDYARTIVTAFQAHASKNVATATQTLRTEIDAVRARLAPAVDVNWQPLASLS